MSDDEILKTPLRTGETIQCTSEYGESFYAQRIRHVAISFNHDSLNYDKFSTRDLLMVTIVFVFVDEMFSMMLLQHQTESKSKVKNMLTFANDGLIS